MSKTFIFPTEWLKFLKNILKESSHNQNGIFSILLLGPKNTGKTTFSLYIANQIIKNKNLVNSSIYFLDCDLGQPLISPMGCVKLVKWNTRDFNIENAKNLNIPVEVMFYIGGNSPIVHPLRYLKGLKQCFEYLRGFKDFILILNMPGWITGIGMEISSIIVSQCIEISNKVFIGFTKEFDSEDPSFRINQKIQMNFFSYKMFDLNLVKNAKDEVISVDNHLGTKVFLNTFSGSLSNGMENSSQRNINPLHFFADYIGYRINNYTPQYSCKTVYFHFNSICIVPYPNTVLTSDELKLHLPRRLTNSVVALCIYNDEQHNFIPDFSENYQKLNILETKIIFPCIGFGIVHHVNYFLNQVVVNTPSWIPSNTLSEVNVLQLTEIMLPLGYPKTALKPYVSKKKFIVQGISSGGKVPSSRKNLKRKIHNI
ncbi:GTPase Grc3p-like Pre-mRNA cleavage complex [Cryptosporidium felis]|nr:GTPase Grc3p-like Pre-mRNA cleavage complex [Cryptosporidium felis]